MPIVQLSTFIITPTPPVNTFRSFNNEPVVVNNIVRGVINPSGVVIRIAGASFELPEPDIEAARVCFELPGPDIEAARDRFEQSGDSFDITGAHFEPSGDSYDITRAHFEPSGDDFEVNRDGFEVNGDGFEANGDSFEANGAKPRSRLFNKLCQERILIFYNLAHYEEKRKI